MKFFIGVDEDSVLIQRLGTPAQHYAWCLDVAAAELMQLEDHDHQTVILRDFEKNMALMPETKAMLSEVVQVFQSLVTSQQTQSYRYLFNAISGLCVPNQGYLIASESLTK